MFLSGFVLMHLTLWDRCGYVGDPDEALRWNMNLIYPSLCNNFSDASFEKLMHDTPQLHGLTLASRPNPKYLHMVSWNTLRTALSAPSMREFNLRHHLVESPHACFEDPTFTPAPLTAFRCTIRDVRPGPRAYPAEAELLGFVLDKLRSSLEILSLSSDIAPYHTLRREEWPRLQSLSLYGDAPAPTRSTLLLRALEQMPQLRSLRFTLALLEGCGDRVLIWPPDVDPPRTRTLPLLEELAVTYPNLQDRLYSHLPSSLRSLSLEDFAPYTSHALGAGRQSYDDAGRSNSTLPSSEILAILRHCPTSSTRSFSVDYHVDGAEGALLAYIATAFPNLETLQLRRYRAQDAEESQEDCAMSVARALAPLTRLKTLRIHLDVVPSPTLITGCFGGLLFDPMSMDAYRGNLRALMDIMVPMLSPALRTVRMLVPSPDLKSAPHWATIRVLRTDSKDWDKVDYGDSSGHGFELMPHYQWENEGHWEDDPESDHWWRYS
ncbi:uncharacterized protein TRAVEDRAFT_46034 [Trametes versicolor FP-101664 SS1]|uniref:uncharacterized protein n=1 Tax=Trametes versicolor (strain FP-101664) TaxID=717944 RepID=UPI00046236EC|nr:uncharacterized protein TRAVEDRAFT_46034 [Trametes versicolor FP-101664 SS1]EIW60792.1 hypothetical protein TRAVEDRAFT_46034 [Trametes versicolor FP-101664 SS1]